MNIIKYSDSLTVKWWRDSNLRWKFMNSGPIASVLLWAISGLSPALIAAGVIIGQHLHFDKLWVTSILAVCMLCAVCTRRWRSMPVFRQAMIDKHMYQCNKNNPLPRSVRYYLQCDHGIVVPEEIFCSIVHSEIKLKGRALVVNSVNNAMGIVDKTHVRALDRSELRHVKNQIVIERARFKAWQ